MTCLATIAAQDSAAKVVRLARVIHEEAPDILGGIRMMKAMDLAHAEGRLHNLIATWGLALPVFMSMLRQGLRYVPILHVPDWFECILQRRPELLLGGYTTEHPDLDHHLRAFWEMYKIEDEHHPVYTRHKDHLHTCVPYFLFGDEGRSYRKSPVMIWSFEAVLGLKTREVFEKNTRGQTLVGKRLYMACLDSQQHTGKLSSLKSRFLLAVLPHLWYKGKRAYVYYSTVNAIAKQCANLFSEGIYHNNKQYFGILIGIKGDSPALTKLGKLNRSFNRLGRDRGICHLCHGGFLNVPWEQMSDEAAWIRTIGQTRPWDLSKFNEILQIPMSPVFPEAMFRNDPFHVCKIGIARHFIASALVQLSSWNTWPGDSAQFDNRMQRAYDDFLFCCKGELGGATPHCKTFTREILHFPRETSFPFGGWKGSDSMLLLRWLVRVIRYGVSQNVGSPRPGRSLVDEAPADRQSSLSAILDAACGMVHFFQILHKCGAWLQPDVADKLCNDVDIFCSAYSYLASRSVASGVCRFHLEPSLHVYRHMSVRMRGLLEKGAERILSPGCFLCEASEDFVGHIARLSRRCAARATCQRTLQRYLIKAHFDWQDLSK